MIVAFPCAGPCFRRGRCCTLLQRCGRWRRKRQRLRRRGRMPRDPRRCWTPQSAAPALPAPRRQVATPYIGRVTGGAGVNSRKRATWPTGSHGFLHISLQEVSPAGRVWFRIEHFSNTAPDLSHSTPIGAGFCRGRQPATLGGVLLMPLGHGAGISGGRGGAGVLSGDGGRSCGRSRSRIHAGG